MSKPLIIRLFMVAFIISATMFVVAAVGMARPAAETEECSQAQDEMECVEKKGQSEFLLEALTRNLLNR